MDKAFLREHFKKIRSEIILREEKERAVINKVTELPEFLYSRTIALYSPIGSELNILSLAKISTELGKKVLFPKVIGQTDMEFCFVKDLAELSVNGKFGINEPTRNTYAEIGEIDMIILPALCFDKNKSRLGYGKGYYDRYLKRAKKAIKVGVSFDEQILQERNIPTDKTDIPCDMIITDKRIIR